MDERKELERWIEHLKTPEGRKEALGDLCFVILLGITVVLAMFL